MPRKASRRDVKWGVDRGGGGRQSSSLAVAVPLDQTFIERVTTATFSTDLGWYTGIRHGDSGGVYFRAVSFLPWCHKPHIDAKVVKFSSLLF